MNATTVAPSQRRPDWLARLEGQVNHAADALMRGVERLVETIEELWTRLTHRPNAKHA